MSVAQFLKEFDPKPRGAPDTPRVLKNAPKVQGGAKPASVQLRVGGKHV